MIQSGKVFAPKPIRKSFISTGVKLDSYFDSNFCPIQHVSMSTKGRKSTKWSKSLSTDSKENFVNSKNVFEFASDLIDEFDEDLAKSEIFSILGRADTTASELKSSLLTSDYLSEVNCMLSETEMDEELIRTSVPIRTSNPFYKNFEEPVNSSPVDQLQGEINYDLDILKSSQLFRRASHTSVEQKEI